MSGGGGGAAGGGGTGGDASGVFYDPEGNLSISGLMLLVGGDGGSSNGAWSGGAGGDIDLPNRTRDITVDGHAILAGGNAGLGGTGGGNGGDVRLTAGTLSLKSDFLMISGSANPSGGQGGAAFLSLDTLAVNGDAPQSFYFRNNGGDFDAAFNTLVLNSDLYMTAAFIDGTAGNTLTFREIQLNGDGREFTIRSSHDFGFNRNLQTIRVSGKNTVITSVLPAGDLTSANGKKLVFNMPANIAAGDTMLTIRQSTAGTALDMGGVSLAVTGAPGGLRPGDRIYLLRVDNGRLSNYSGLIGQEFTNSVGGIYTLGFSGNDAMYIGIEQAFNSERFKNLAQSRLGALEFLNQGADMALGEILPTLKRETPDSGLIPFVNVRMSDSRYDSGGRIEADGINMVTGLGWGQVFEGGPRWTSGFFLEFGWGDLESRARFSGQETVKGKGDSEYFGAGLLTRLDIGNGLYFDASGRFGKADIDFHSDNIGLDQRHEYDESVWYYGAHAGAGYELPLGDSARLDVHGRFIWTRLDSDSFKTEGEKLRFDSLDSYRLRLGGRLDVTVCEWATPYVGAAWEHEFDAKQQTRVNDKRIKSVDLEGDSVIGELGLRFVPSQLNNLHLDLNVQAYGGERDGFSGGLRFKYEF